MNQPAARLPFYEEVKRRLNEFGPAMLAAVPELDAIVIVPSYTIPQNSVSAGNVYSRSNLTNPTEIMHVATQLNVVLQNVNMHLLQFIQRADAELTRLKEEVRGQEEQAAALALRIQTLNEKLAEHGQSPSPGAADRGAASGA